MFQHVRRQDDIEHAVLEREVCRRRDLQLDANRQAGPSDLSPADPNQVGRDVDAGRWMDEGDPFGQRDQDVANAAAEVEHPILRRNAGRSQDAPVRGIDHPEAASRKDVPHADAAQAAGEPFAIAVANGGLVDSVGAIAHWPQPPAARRPGRPPRSRSIC